MVDIEWIESYTKDIIPKIENELSNCEDESKLLELYNLYVDVLKMIAPYDFITYNKYLELDDDHNSPNKAFYFHRKKHLAVIFEALNDMEIYDKYDLVLISLAPRVGKTTTGIRFLSWVTGRHPENTQLATSYSDNITTSFYTGVMEIVMSDRFNEVFPQSPLINQNAKREEIWLKVAKRYPSITFVPINGSMTGRCEAGNYLYCDDLVSGFEEAVSITRMVKLWNLYTVNCKQRKKDKAKEIHIATIWSVHDVISKLTRLNKDNPRCKIINIDCYDENGESNFDFFGGFSTEYYRELEKTMDKFSFDALYRGRAIEREGILYNADDLMYYMRLPDETADTTIAICDSKNLGKDYVCSIVGKVYGDFIYVEDVVYNNGLPEITRPAVADLWDRNKVVRGDVELNNGGNYYAEDLQELLNARNCKASIRIFYTGNNKVVKIITYSDFVKKYFIFKDPSQYTPRSDYGRFMEDLLSWTQTGTNEHDDAPDAVAMLAQLFQDMNNNQIKILDRKKLNL